MKAVMLAAGMGSRLFGTDSGEPPKALMRFGGKSLLERHIDTLRALGIEGLALVVGYQSELLLGEVARLGAEDFVTPVENPDFREGTIVSLWQARGHIDEGFVFMDADVLYAPALLERLLTSGQPSSLLLDRGFEPGDEPVKVCVEGGRIVDFGKQVDQRAYDMVGEWPGFMKLAAAEAQLLGAIMDEMVAAGERAAPMEDAMRRLMLERAPGAVGVEDVTGLPWIEIDFPEDWVRAETEILPRIEAH